MRNLSICFVLLTAIMAACSSGGRKSALTAAIGQASEVLLVMDAEVMASDLKDSLRDELSCPIPGLTRDEPFFRVSRVPFSIYKGEMLKMHSKLLVRIDAAAQACSLGQATNVDALGQLQLLLVAPSVEALRDYLHSHASQIRQRLLDHQLHRQQRFLKKHHSRSVRKELKRMKLDGLLPEAIAWTKTGQDFLWGSSRSADRQLNFVCYTLPAADTTLPDLRRQMEIRDSVMQRNIPGSRPGQWMETVWEKGEPVVLGETLQLDGRTIAVARGLWQMHNGAMGGPFVAFSWWDEPHHRLVVCEGFVYSPPTDKRDLLRSLEAGIRTVESIKF